MICHLRQIFAKLALANLVFPKIEKKRFKSQLNLITYPGKIKNKKKKRETRKNRFFHNLKVILIKEFQKFFYLYI